MLTMDALKAMGVDTAEGLGRCMNNEQFYMNLVKMIPGDANFQGLQDALSAKDLDKAFEAAHALKGVLANLSLTPLQQPASEITELLRSRTDMDYTPLMNKLMEQRDKLAKLCD